MTASWVPAAVVLMGVLLLGGCNTRPSRLAAMQQLAQATSNAADLLATVKDKASAAAAAPKMQELLAKMVQLDSQLEAAEMEDDLAFEEEPELSALASYIAAQSRFIQEQRRIGAIQELREGLGPVWQEMTAGIYDPGGAMALDGGMEPARTGS